MLTALIWIVAILLAVFVVKALCDHGREQNQKKQEEKEPIRRIWRKRGFRGKPNMMQG